MDSYSSTAVTRDGVLTAADEDGVLSVASALSKEASLLFQSRKYANCVDVLTRLSLMKKKKHEPKVLHNIAVGEFFRDGCSDPKKFLQELTNVEKKYEACKSREVLDTALPADKCAAVAKLNKAIVLYHLHKYPTAKQVLEPLFQNLVPIDEVTSLHVCLLLLDLAFATQDASKFAEVLGYMEKAFKVGRMINHANDGSTGHQPSELVAKSSSVSSNTSTADDLNLDASSNVPTSNERSSSADLKLNLPLYRVQLLFLTRNLKRAKRDLKSAMKFARDRDYSNALLLKSQLELSRGNFAKAEKILKASCDQLGVGSSIIYDNNAGCIFYQWRKHNTAGVFFNKALLSCSSLRKEKSRDLATISQDKSLFILYNSGLHYLVCGKPILAVRCFQKASLVFSNMPLLWLRLAECSLMAVNKGLSKSFHSMLSVPEFKVSVVGQGKWRHLAVEDGLTRKGHERCNLGSGQDPNLSISYARQCLWNALHLVKDLEPKSGKSVLPMNTTPEESKNTSNQANASGDTKEQKGGAAVSSSFPLYEAECREKYLKIKQVILADLAFVELELENPQVALSKAQSLLEIPECSKMYAFLARVYAAEALCLLNKPNEAAEILSVYVCGGNNIDLPYTKEDLEQLQANRPFDPQSSNATSTEEEIEQLQANEPLNPESSNATSTADKNPDFVFYTPEEAQGTLFLNLASLYVMQRDIKQATHFSVQALSLIPDSPKANLMAVYLDLKIGRVQQAVSRLRSCTCVSFVPVAQYQTSCRNSLAHF